MSSSKLQLYTKTINSINEISYSIHDFTDNLQFSGLYERFTSVRYSVLIKYIGNTIQTFKNLYNDVKDLTYTSELIHFYHITILMCDLLLELYHILLTQSG